MATAKAKLAKVATEAKSCTRCPLYRNATQTVFGEGPVGARLMLVGEQPGDQEDLAGKPFVGPAGKMLDKALAEAGVDRTKVYVTNVVKHFKNEPRGKRRLHKKPNRSEVEVCKVARPGDRAGPPATRAGDGRHGRLGAGRQSGHFVETARPGDRLCRRPARHGDHPSVLDLRAPDEAGRHQAYAGLVKDLKLALKTVARLPQAA